MAAGERVSDPHPSTEEHYDRERHPGGAHPPKGKESGVSVAEHDGSAPPRPRNLDRGADSAPKGESSALKKE